MSSINDGHTKRYDFIDKSLWSKCLICNKSIKEIKKEIGGSGTYFAEAFKQHIESHGISLTEYFIEYVKLEARKCHCNICNKNVKIGCHGSKMYWRKYACGRYEGLVEWSKNAKETRKGINNPMFQKTPWNKGKTKETDSRIKSVSTTKGTHLSLEHKQKLRDARKRSPVKIRHCVPHSEKTKEFLRQNTLRLIKNGILSSGKKTKPHIKMGIILDELNIKYEEEKISGYYAFDYYLLDFNIYIEVDGDYWHSNPKFYPNRTKK